MNIFEFFQALKRKRRFLLITLGAWLLVVLLGSFEFDDGLEWRIGPRYESTVQILVTESGIDGLASGDLAGAGDTRLAATVYSIMLESTEAINDVSDRLGIEIESVDVGTSRDAPYLEVRVVAPTEQGSSDAAFALVDWLGERLREPVTTLDIPTTTTIPEVDTDGPFESFIRISAAQTLIEEYGDLFLAVNAGDGERTIALSETAAGLEIPTELGPVVTVRTSLEDTSAERYSTLQLNAPALPDYGDRYPALEITLLPSAIVEPTIQGDDVPPVRLAMSGITLRWVPGASLVPEFAPGTDLSVVVLTENPVAEPIGQRRGPILAVAALTIGAVLILSLAILIDTWQQEARRHLAMIEDAEPEMADSSASTLKSVDTAGIVKR